MARTTPVHSGYTIINGSGTGPNGDRIDVWIEYTTSQDVINNRSHIKAYFYAALHPGESSETHGSSGCYSSFSVNGTSGSNLKDNGSYDFQNTTPNSLGTFDGYIAHNEDGTKTIAISGKFTTSSSWITGGNASGSVILPTISRGKFRVNVSGTWKEATPYVNVSGTWKKALAYTNVSGTWKIGLSV